MTISLGKLLAGFPLTEEQKEILFRQIRNDIGNVRTPARAIFEWADERHDRMKVTYRYYSEFQP